MYGGHIEKIRKTTATLNYYQTFYKHLLDNSQPDRRKFFFWQPFLTKQWPHLINAMKNFNFNLWLRSPRIPRMLYFSRAKASLFRPSFWFRHFDLFLTQGVDHHRPLWYSFEHPLPFLNRNPCMRFFNNCIHYAPWMLCK